MVVPRLDTPLDTVMYYTAPLFSPLGWKYVVSLIPERVEKRLGMERLTPEEVAREAYERYAGKDISLGEFEKRAFFGGEEDWELGSPIAQLALAEAGSTLAGAVVSDIGIPVVGKVSKLPIVQKIVSTRPVKGLTWAGEKIMKVLSHPTAPLGFGAWSFGTEYISSSEPDKMERALAKGLKTTAQLYAIQHGFERGAKWGLPLKYREINIPTEGDQMINVWKGISFEYDTGTGAIPLIGKSEGKFVIGSEKIIETLPRVLPQEAVIPTTPTEARIFYEYAKRYMSPEDVEAIRKSLVIMKGLGGTRSAFIDRERLHEATRRLPKEAVDDVIDTLRTGKWDTMIGGSKAHYAQVRPEIPDDVVRIAEKRGLSEDVFKPADIDLDMLSGTPDDALNLASNIYEKWKMRGLPVQLKLTGGGTPQIYMRVGGKWQKVLEVLHPETVANDVMIASQLAESSWGVPLPEAPETVEGVKLQKLGEQVKRKIGASIGVRAKGTELGPKTWREKDVPTGLWVAESAQASEESRLLSRILKGRKLKRTKEAIEYMKGYWLRRGIDLSQFEVPVAYFPAYTVEELPSISAIPSALFSAFEAPSYFGSAPEVKVIEKPSKPKIREKPSKEPSSVPQPTPKPSIPSPAMEYPSLPSFPIEEPSYPSGEGEVSSGGGEYEYEYPSYPSISPPSYPSGSTPTFPPSLYYGGFQPVYPSVPYSRLPGLSQFGVRGGERVGEEEAMLETVWIPEF